MTYVNIKIKYVCSSHIPPRVWDHHTMGNTSKGRNTFFDYLLHYIYIMLPKSMPLWKCLNLETPLILINTEYT